MTEVDALVAIQYYMRHRRNVSSESSSSSDEEWDVALKAVKRNRKKRPRCLNYEEVINQYSIDDFKSHFRMSRDTFDYLHQLLKNDLIRKIPGCPAISSRIQLMVTLWKMATTDSYRSICDRFNIGRATAIRAVRRITTAIFNRAPQFIQWPIGDDAAAVMHGFERTSMFPRTIGAVDGTHIQIDAPTENAVDYINRKGYHSIQLQLVCDNKCLITHCYVGHPGSVHDQRVFQLSELPSYLNTDAKFPNDSHILGDSAYEIHQHLLTPFRDNGHLTARQRDYNYHHSAARIVVERCIGLLKGRMRSLLHCLPINRVDLMAQYIVACCVIHNICILRRDEENIIITSRTDGVENVDQNANFHEGRKIAGIRKRNIIMETLPQE